MVGYERKTRYERREEKKEEKKEEKRLRKVLAKAKRFMHHQADDIIRDLELNAVDALRGNSEYNWESVAKSLYTPLADFYDLTGGKNGVKGDYTGAGGVEKTDWADRIAKRLCKIDKGIEKQESKIEKAETKLGQYLKKENEALALKYCERIAISLDKITALENERYVLEDAADWKSEQEDKAEDSTLYLDLAEPISNSESEHPTDCTTLESALNGSEERVQERRLAHDLRNSDAQTASVRAQDLLAVYKSHSQQDSAEVAKAKRRHVELEQILATSKGN